MSGCAGETSVSQGRFDQFEHPHVPMGPNSLKSAQSRGLVKVLGTLPTNTVRRSFSSASSARAWSSASSSSLSLLAAASPSSSCSWRVAASTAGSSCRCCCCCCCCFSFFFCFLDGLPSWPSVTAAAAGAAAGSDDDCCCLGAGGAGVDEGVLGGCASTKGARSIDPSASCFCRRAASFSLFRGRGGRSLPFLVFFAVDSPVPRRGHMYVHT